MVVLVQTRKSPGFGRLDGPDGHLEQSRPAQDALVGGGQAVQVDAQGDAVGERDLGQRPFQQHGVGAEIDVLAAPHQFCEEFEDRGIDEGLPAGNGDHRGAAFLHRAQAFLQGQGLLQGVMVFLDAAATGAGEIALVGGLQHQDQGKLILALKPLGEEIAAQSQG